MPKTGVARALSHPSLPHPLHSPCELNDLEWDDPCPGNCERMLLSLTAQNDDNGKLNAS